MNKTVFVSIIIIAVSILVGFYIHTQNTRFYLQSTGKGIAYKIDRKTGQTWLIVGDRQELIIGSDQNVKSYNKKNIAIELAKQSNVFDGYLDTDSQLKSWLREKKGDLIIFGWEANEVSADIYLVSYLIDQGGQKFGYHFEVNLIAEIVRLVTGDPELEESYGLK